MQGGYSSAPSNAIHDQSKGPWATMPCLGYAGWLSGSIAAGVTAQFCTQGARFQRGLGAQWQRHIPCQMACVATGRWSGVAGCWGWSQCLALWRRWYHQAGAAYYGDAPESFVVVEKVEIPCPRGDGDMSCETSSL